MDLIGSNAAYTHKFFKSAPEYPFVNVESLSIY